MTWNPQADKAETMRIGTVKKYKSVGKIPTDFVLFLSIAFIKFPAVSMSYYTCDSRDAMNIKIIHGFFAKFLIIPLTRTVFGDII